MRTQHATTTIRAGDVLITTTTKAESVYVEFDDILSAVKVSPDEWMSDAPWEWCDGYSHTTERAADVECAEDRRGCCWDDGNRERIVNGIAICSAGIGSTAQANKSRGK